MKLTYTVFKEPITAETKKSDLQNQVRRCSLNQYEPRLAVPYSQFVDDSLNRIILPALFRDYSPGARRNDSNVLGYPSFIALDFDTPAFSHRDFVHMFPELNCLIVASQSHMIDKGDAPACERFHIYVFLESGITSKEIRNFTRDYFFKLLPAFLSESERGPKTAKSVADESLTYSGVLYPGKSVLYEKLDGHNLAPVLDELDLNKRLIGEGVSPSRDSEFVELLKSKNLWSESIGYVSDSVLSLVLDGIPRGTRWDNISLCVFSLYNAGVPPSGCREILLQTLKKNGGDTADNLAKLDRAVKRVTGMKRVEKYYRPRDFGTVGVSNRGSAVIDEVVVAKERDRIIDEVCSKYLRFHRNESRTIIYSLKEEDQLTFCPNEDFSAAAIAKDLSAVKIPVIRKYGNHNYVAYEVWPPKRVLDRWVISGRGLDSEPAEFRFKSAPGYCIRRLPFDLTVGEFPSWREGLSRMSCAETFMAYVGSVLDLNNRSRQALWLHGPKGQDGKSVMARVLGSVFGDAHATMNTDVSTQFMYAPLFNKRLVTLPDLKDTHFVKTSQFRKIVSGDPVSIERKGENAFTAILNVKLFICSNYPPTVTSGNADLSRLIVIKIDQSKNRDDETWERRLTEELPYFLHACVEVYKNKVPPGKSMIPLPESSVNMLKSAAKSSEIEFRNAFDAVFIRDSRPEGRDFITEDEAYSVLCTKRINESYLIKKSDFRRFLTYLQTDCDVDLVFDSSKNCNLLVGLKIKDDFKSESGISIT